MGGKSSTFNTTTEVTLNKALNPNCSLGAAMAAHCSVCVCACARALDGLNAEHEFRVWDHTWPYVISIFFTLIFEYISKYNQQSMD